MPGFSPTASFDPTYNQWDPNTISSFGGANFTPANQLPDFTAGMQPTLNLGGLNGSSGLGSWFSGATPLQWGQLGLSGLGTLGSLIAGFGSLGVANKQLDLSTKMANANLANQTQAYNTNLADRERVRGAWEGLSPAQVNAYITANSLKKFSV